MPMTTAEVAALFRVSTSQVRRWAEAGKLPHFRTPGGQLRFLSRDINRVRFPGLEFDCDE